MLIAIFDADANFIYVNVGAQRSNNDASVLKQTNFYKEENRLNLPNPEPIVPNSESLPFFFIEDGGFGIEKHLMKPYGGM